MRLFGIVVIGQEEAHQVVKWAEIGFVAEHP